LCVSVCRFEGLYRRLPHRLGKGVCCWKGLDKAAQPFHLFQVWPLAFFKVWVGVLGTKLVHTAEVREKAWSFGLVSLPGLHVTNPR